MSRRPMASISRLIPSLLALMLLASDGRVSAQMPEVVPVEGQPLAANVERVARALELLGAPLPGETAVELARAVAARDAGELQRRLDRHVLLVVGINPEERVRVARGPAPAVLQQEGYTPVLVKVITGTQKNN